MSYQTLDEILRNGREWELADRLEVLAPDRRMEDLERLFYRAVRGYDDDGSLALFRFMMQAIKDQFMLPYTRQHEGTQQLILGPQVGAHEQFAKAEYEMAMKRAGLAKRIFHTLPMFRPNRKLSSEEFRSAGDHMGDVISPVLSKTKKAVLVEIANGWKIAQDENTADAFLRFILESAEAAAEFWTKEWNSKERTVYEEVIRGITNQNFPAQRLAHALATIDVQDKRNHWGITECIAHGWVRLSRSYDLRNAFLIIEQVSDFSFGRSGNDSLASDAVVQYVRNTARDAQRLEGILLKATLAVLKPEYGGGKISVEFSNPVTATIVVHQEGAEDKGQVGNTATFDKMCKAIRNALAPLQSEMPRYQLRLRYVGTKRWTPNEVMFKIEDAL